MTKKGGSSPSGSAFTKPGPRSAVSIQLPLPISVSGPGQSCRPVSDGRESGFAEVVTDALPVTKVGKVDKKALRSYGRGGHIRGAAMAVMAPRTVAPAQNARASTYPDAAGKPACAEATMSAAAS